MAISNDIKILKSKKRREKFAGKEWLRSFKIWIEFAIEDNELYFGFEVILLGRLQPFLKKR